jgi:YaaC-like Protein
LGLRRFHNVEVVQTIISDLHKVPRNNPNIKKQAIQIRYCLQQAREYFDSAKSVPLVTKPVLLYYSIMNRALVEILLKQDGNSSLDKSREQHRHHELIFSFTENKNQTQDLAKQAGALPHSFSSPVRRELATPIGLQRAWPRSPTNGRSEILARTRLPLPSPYITSIFVFGWPAARRRGLVDAMIQSGVPGRNEIVLNPTYWMEIPQFPDSVK